MRGHLADNSADLAIFAGKTLYLAMHELLDVVFKDRTAGSQLIWGSDAPRNIVPLLTDVVRSESIRMDQKNGICCTGCPRPFFLT